MKVRKMLKAMVLTTALLGLVLGCAETNNSYPGTNLTLEEFKELMLRHAPDNLTILKIVATEKSTHYSTLEVQQFVEAKSKIHADTPIQFTVSLKEVVAPPQPNKYEETPPECQTTPLCGDLYFAYFYAEAPSGEIDPSTMREGIVAFRYIYEENATQPVKMVSYRFIDNIKVTSTVSFTVLNAVTDEPIEGAKAYVEFPNGDASFLSSSDKAGKGKVYGVMEGLSILHVFASSFEEVSIQIRTEEGKDIYIGVVRLLPIITYQHSTLKGEIFFEDCTTPVKPVFLTPDTKITPIIYLLNEDGSDTAISPGIVDAKGNYVIDLVPRGNYQLRIRVQNAELIAKYGEETVNSDHILISVNKAGEIINLKKLCVKNNPPRIQSINAPSIVEPGSTITIDALADDPDGDALTFFWSADAGTISQPVATDSTAYWTAPQELGIYTITLKVNDSFGGVAEMRKDITVARVRNVVWQNEVPITNPDGNWSVTSFLYGFGPSRNAATDYFGNTVFVWSDYKDGNWEIYLNYIANGTFSEELRVTNDLESSVAPSVVVDEYEKAHVVWTSIDSNFNTFAMYALVDVEGRFVINTQKLSPVFSSSPSIVIDSTGKVHIVWIEETANGSVVTYATSTNGVLSSATALSPLQGNAAYPDIAVAPDGTVYVVWSQLVDGNWEVMARIYTESGWSDIIRLTNSAGSSIWARIATDSSGKLHIVWTDWKDGDVPGVFYKNYDPQTGVWSSEVKLNESNVNAWGPAILVDNEDYVHVVWTNQRTGSKDLFYRISDRGFAWQDEVQLTNTSSVSYAPSLALISDGFYTGVGVIFTDNRNGYPELYGKPGVFTESGFVQ